MGQDADHNLHDHESDDQGERDGEAPGVCALAYPVHVAVRGGPMSVPGRPMDGPGIVVVRGADVAGVVLHRMASQPLRMRVLTVARLASTSRTSRDGVGHRTGRGACHSTAIMGIVVGAERV